MMAKMVSFYKSFYFPSLFDSLNVGDDKSIKQLEVIIFTVGGVQSEIMYGSG